MRTAAASKIQEQFWLLNQLAPESAVYNIANLVEIDQEPDLKLLKATFLEIIKQNEILRTSFSFEDGIVVQNVLSPDQITFSIEAEVLQHNIIPGGKLPKEIDDEVCAPFDLKIAPLLRVKAFSSPERYYLLIIFHHIITDLHTKELFEAQFASTYKQLQKSIYKPNQNGNSQYIDFSIWQKQWLKSDECARMKKEWLSELPSPDTLLNLPVDYKRPNVSSLTGERKYFSLSEELTTGIHNYAQSTTSYSFLILLTVYAIKLHKISNQKKIVIGVPLTNRRTDENKSIFGCFINIAPICIDFSDSPSVADIRKQIRNKLLTAHRKQEIPFLSLLDGAEHQRKSPYNPFFQAGFTSEPLMNLKIDGLNSNPIPFEKSGSQLDIFLTFWEGNDRFHCYLEYSTELFKSETIEYIKQAFIELAQLVTQNNDTEIHQLNSPACEKLLKLISTKKFNVAHRYSPENNKGNLKDLEKLIKIISEIWVKLLSKKDLDINANFFDLGGNSLLALSFINELKIKLTRKVELLDVLQHPTVTKLAKYINQLE